MVIDSDAQIIWVFGGRVIDGDWNGEKYSGLYSYNIRMSKWRLLQSVHSSECGLLLTEVLPDTRLPLPRRTTIFPYASVSRGESQILRAADSI